MPNIRIRLTLMLSVTIALVVAPASLPAEDCNENEIPNVCEPFEDCNSNGVTDICDIGGFTSQDCNGNLIPDECEIDANSTAPGGPFFCNSGCADDCDNDGIPDACGVGPNAVQQPILADSALFSAGTSDNHDGVFRADDFVIHQQSEISAVEVQAYLIAFNFPNLEPTRPTFRVSIYHDNPGPSLQPLTSQYRIYDVPGEIIETFIAPSYSMTPTGNVTVFGGTDIFEYTFIIQLPQHLVLDPGAYWLSVGEISEAPDEAVFAWSRGELDPYRGRFGHVRSHNEFSWVQFPQDQIDLAFSLHLTEDCDESGVLDSCEIAADPGLDCPNGIGNGILDFCEVDCDLNGVADTCDIELGNIDDCDHTQTADECDIAAGSALDVNANAIPDSCESDCDINGVPDDWQVETGVAFDADSNGTLDHCEVPGPGNAECVDATPICPGITYSGSTVGDHDGWVWYSWTPATFVDQSLIRVDTCGSQIPLVVEGGCAGNDDIFNCDVCNTMSFRTRYVPDITRPDECVRINFDALEAQPGTEYLFAIRSDGPEEGEYQFRLTFTAGTVEGNCINAPTLPEPFNDCDANGVPDDAQPDEDCNSNGVRDICEEKMGISTDCDQDGVPDECMMIDCNNNGTHDACESDCNRNGTPDDCDIATGTSMDCNGDGGPDECDPFGRYGSQLSINGTPVPDHWFVGPPDSLGEGVGGQIIEYDFAGTRIVDGAGPDFNVYEYLQWGLTRAEFEKIDVLVSDDGVNFVSVKGTEAPHVAIPGDESHFGDFLAKSYDLAGTGFAEVRFVRIEGNGDEPGGSYYGFDLDAIGAIHFSSPDACAIPGDCDADGDVDLTDYADMSSCMQGPGGGMIGGCGCFDLDNNGDIDLCDYSEFMVNFGQ